MNAALISSAVISGVVGAIIGAAGGAADDFGGADWDDPWVELQAASMRATAEMKSVCLCIF
jgi:hypothetical protein